MKQTGITTFALAMLITGAVNNIRNLPSAALFGTSLIFFFIFSAIFFLIPTALVSAELASGQAEKNGIYHWVKAAFGEKLGFLSIWLQWVTNLVWFPTALSFVAGVTAYLMDPALAQNKFYLIGTMLGAFWIVTLINLKGIDLSARIVSICTVIGLVLPLILMMSLAAVWFFSGQPLHIQLTHATLLPNLRHLDGWTSLTAIMTGLAGIELAAVHARDVKNPQKTFPRALHLSVWIILTTMIVGSLAIAMVLPREQINLVNGALQAFASFFKAYHIEKWIPVITVMILIGSFGSMISWVISPARGLLQAAQSGYLPLFLRKENKHGVAANLLLTQAAIVTVVCFAFLFMPSVSSSYWLLTALSTQLYMLMYVLLFLSALRLRYKISLQSRAFKIPGGKWGMGLVCLFGLIGCIITLIVGFFPPQGLDLGQAFSYRMIFGSGMVVMTLPILFFYAYKYITSEAALGGEAA